jgi:hypothetical protein
LSALYVHVNISSKSTKVEQRFHGGRDLFWAGIFGFFTAADGSPLWPADFSNSIKQFIIETVGPI